MVHRRRQSHLVTDGRAASVHEQLELLAAREILLRTYASRHTLVLFVVHWVARVLKYTLLDGRALCETLLSHYFLDCLIVVPWRRLLSCFVILLCHLSIILQIN